MLIGITGIAQEERAKLEKIVEEDKQDFEHVEALNKLFRIDRDIDPDKAKLFLEDALSISRKYDIAEGKALTLMHMGMYFVYKGVYTEAVEAYQEARSNYEEINDKTGQSKCNNGLGVLETQRGDYTKALEYYHAALDLNKEENDIEGMAVCYHNIGGLHFRLKHHEKAEEFVTKGLRLKESIKDSVGIVGSMNSLGGMKTARGQYREALSVLFKALDLARKFNVRHEIGHISINIGVQYHYLNKVDSSKYYYLQALNHFKKTGDKSQYGHIYLNLGGLEMLKGNAKLAIVYFDSCLANGFEVESVVFITSAYKGLTDAYKKLGDYKATVETMEKFKKFEDSLSGERVQNQINELQLKYETEVMKNEAELKDKELIKLEKKEAEANSVADRRRSYIFIAIAISVMIISILLFYFYRRKVRENQKRVELEQKALRSQMNPHFIFNSLGAIQQMYVNGEMDLANNYIGDFGQLMRQILTNSGKNLITVKEELEMLRLYLDLEKGRNMELINYEFEVDEKIDQRGIMIPPLVIQPFVENAIWHGILPSKKAGNIIVRLSLMTDSNKLLCEVEDNGIGIKNSTKKAEHESKGMEITEQRLGSKVQVSSLNQGTIVKFEIPIK